MDYDRQQLDNFLAKSQIQTFPNSEINVAQTQIQQPQRGQQGNKQSQPVRNTQLNRTKDKEETFFQQFGANYDAKKNKLQKELQNDFSQFMQQVGFLFEGFSC